MQQSSSFLDGLGRLLESRGLGRFLSFVVIPVLVLLTLLLPPVQLAERIQNLGHTEITPRTASLADPDGTRVLFPVEGLQSTGSAYGRLSAIPRADFERGDASEELRKAAQALPGHLRPRSPIYQVSIRGAIPRSTAASIPIPNDSLPYETLDIYNWNGEAWEWMPHALVLEDDTIEFDVNFVPNAFMVVQTSPRLPEVGVIAPAGKQLPAEAVASTTALFPAVLTLRGDGSVDGAVNLPTTSGAAYETYLTARNFEPGAVPRTDLLANILIDGALQEIQINTLAELAASQLYAGVGIDYRGVDPPLRMDFSRFVQNLAARLHQDGKKLAVFVDRPLQVAENTWETFGYDWRALGASADLIVLPGPENPLAYAPGGSVEALLDWAVGEVDRNKLLLQLPARTMEQAENYFIARGYGEALAPILGEPAVSSEIIEPGSAVQAGLQADIVASPLQFDPTTGISWYRYRGQSGEERIVFLEDAASLAHKVSLANRFNLGGVMVSSLESDDIDANTWSVLASYAAGQSPALSAPDLGVAWTVADEQGNVVATQRSELNQVVALAVPDAPGNYSVRASLVDGERTVAEQGQAQVAVATYTPTPTPTPEFTPTPTVTPTPEATPTPTPLPFAIARANGDTNLRGGPGTNYGVVGLLRDGQELRITGKNPNGTWWEVERENGQAAWIIANRVTAVGPADAVAVAENIPEPPPPPAAPAAPAAGGGGSPAPRPAGSGSFGYGIQIDPNADKNRIAGWVRDLGFTWIKWQTPWKDLEGAPGQINWGGEDDRVNFFAGQGFQLLASIVKSPAWARPGNTNLGVEGPPADPQTFANFLGAYAGRYCGRVQAIEVWNEQNLHYEWGDEPLSPARYMELLRRSYQSIKAACPQMIVISGAPTPAGNVGSLAMDDIQYLEAMYQNGLRNYSDAIGAHPSGYNVPPSLTWQQACDFINRKGASFRGACDSPHHSWSARSTMEGYRAVMQRYGDGNKRIWPTEFGWAAGGALHPAYGYANDNTRAEQAQWTVEFYQWMRGNGYTGPAFLWNLNYGVTHPTLELAQWGILDAGGNPLPVYTALRNMPK